MKVVSVALARSIWLLEIADLNPKGRYMVPVYSALLTKYKFMKFPKLAEVNWQQGLKLEDGEFQLPEGDKIAVNLTIFSDGLVADTRSSTTGSDAFIEDTLNYLTNEFNYSSYHQILRRKAYSSELSLHIDQSLNTLNPSLSQLASGLSSQVASGQSSDFELGISLVSDPGPTKTFPLTFKLERDVRFPFSENRYYSLAPLETHAHIKFLEDLGNLLSA